MQFEGDRHPVVGRLVQKRTPSGGQFAERFVDDPRGPLGHGWAICQANPPERTGTLGVPMCAEAAISFRIWSEAQAVRSPPPKAPGETQRTSPPKRGDGQHLSLQITGQLGDLQAQCSQPPEKSSQYVPDSAAWSSRWSEDPNPESALPGTPVRRTIPQTTPASQTVVHHAGIGQEDGRPLDAAHVKDPPLAVPRLVIRTDGNPPAGHVADSGLGFSKSTGPTMAGRLTTWDRLRGGMAGTWPNRPEMIMTRIQAKGSP
ncbi:MAG: hypothetical protein Ct9H300mP1_16560 [Planctomycetaceae bacterium]|nr:MAG: hypothetical protein Ct9H300mP1_16560 [Planctomycetaceae bacterium]